MESPAVRPTLLTIGMALSGLTGCLFLLVLLLAPFDIGTYTIDGEEVPGPEFLRTSGIALVAAGALLVAISATLARNHPLSRELMIAFWVASGVVNTILAFRSGSYGCDLTWLPALAIAIWYLYFKPNVVAYYRGTGRPSRRLPFEAG